MCFCNIAWCKISNNKQIDTCKALPAWLMFNKPLTSLPHFWHKRLFTESSFTLYVHTYLSNTGPDPVKITKLPTHHSSHLNDVSLVGRWWPAFSSVLIIIKRCQSWTPWQNALDQCMKYVLKGHEMDHLYFKMDVSLRVQKPIIAFNRTTWKASFTNCWQWRVKC